MDDDVRAEIREESLNQENRARQKEIDKLQRALLLVERSDKLLLVDALVSALREKEDDRARYGRALSRALKLLDEVDMIPSTAWKDACDELKRLFS